MPANDIVSRESHVLCMAFAGNNIPIDQAMQARDPNRSPCANHPDCRTCESEEVLSKVSADLDPSIVTSDD